MKKILLIFLVVILSLTAVGCSDETTSASKVSNPVAEEATKQAIAAEKQSAEIAAAKAAEAEAAEAAKVAAEKAAKEKAEAEAAKVAAEKAAKEKAEAEAKAQQPTVIADGDYLVTVNLSTNKLTLFSGSQVVAVYSVATGKLKNGVSLTPTGQFTVLKKIPDPAWGGAGVSEPIPGGDPRNPLGHYWIGTSCGPNPGGSIGIHGNKDESSIGTYASLGCVRMHNSEIPILYNTVTIGTKVWIGYSNQLTDWGVVGFN